MALTLQCLVFAITLFKTKRGRKVSNHYLALLLAFFSVQVLLSLLEGHGFYFRSVARSIPLLYGPLFLIYTKTLTDINFQWQPRHLLHLTPLALSIVFYAVAPNPLFAIRVFVLLQFTAYSLYSLALISKFVEAQKQCTPNLVSINFQWVAELFAGIILIMIVSIRLDILHTELLFNSLTIFLLLIINLIGFRGALKPNVFLGVSEINILAVQDLKERYANSALSPQLLKAHAEKIEQMMLTERPYLEDDISLVSFAIKLDLSPRVVSQVINQHFEKNFSDYINDHRLTYAKSLLANTSSSEKNISEVIFESGFSSKTRFYTLFKQKTGLSPKAYRLREQK